MRRDRSRSTAEGRADRRWNRIVAASAAIVVLVALLTAVGWLVSRTTRVSTYSVSGPLRTVDLALGAGDAVIVGSSSATVQVRRTDDYSFGHLAREQRSFANGVLRVSSGCPKIVVGSCSARYEVAVPETVHVNVHTTAGNIRLTGFRGEAAVQSRSGSVDVEAYCGFNLSALSRSGNVHVATACAPEHLRVRTDSGTATALVPPGRYQITAAAAAGRERIRGVVPDRHAPFTIDARSASGAVVVEGGI